MKTKIPLTNYPTLPARRTGFVFLPKIGIVGIIGLTVRNGSGIDGDSLDSFTFSGRVGECYVCFSSLQFW
jgi:hypothetical protein